MYQRRGTDGYSGTGRTVEGSSTPVHRNQSSSQPQSWSIPRSSGYGATSDRSSNDAVFVTLQGSYAKADGVLSSNGKDKRREAQVWKLTVTTASLCQQDKRPHDCSFSCTQGLGGDTLPLWMAENVFLERFSAVLPLFRRTANLLPAFSLVLEGKQ